LRRDRTLLVTALFFALLLRLAKAETSDNLDLLPLAVTDGKLSSGKGLVLPLDTTSPDCPVLPQLFRQGTAAFTTVRPKPLEKRHSVSWHPPCYLQTKKTGTVRPGDDSGKRTGTPQASCTTRYQ
jgi:hypothetical protein